MTSIFSFWNFAQNLFNDSIDYRFLEVYIMQLESKNRLRESGQRARQIRGLKPANILVRIRSPGG
jgi:hypothetical protein